MQPKHLFLFILCTVFLNGCEDAARWAYDNGLSMEKSRAGLEDQTLTTADGIEWHLLVSEPQNEESTDKKETVLLIHGFSADSSNWIRFANELEGDFVFVVPDLPGHGQTTRTLNLDYTMAAQASRLLTLMDALDIQQFHVAGNSMGGAISLAIAQQAPERVLSMGLVDSAGLTRQTKEFKNVLAKSESNPLIPHKAEQFQTTLKWAMEEPPYMPGFFIDIMGQKKAENADVAEKVWGDLMDDPGMELEDKNVLPTIQTPTLVLWGREDRLLGVDNVAAFLEELPQSRAVILDGIGHVPMAEAPGKSADAFRAFWSEARP